MRHASPPDDRVERVAKAAPSNWRTAIGLSSPSSGTEVVYGSPDDYDEEDPPAQSPSPATKKRRHEEFQKDLDEISTGSDEYDPTGKTPEQLDAMIAKYKRDATASRIAAAKRRSIFQGNRWFPALRDSLISHWARCAEMDAVMNRRAAQLRSLTGTSSSIASSSSSIAAADTEEQRKFFLFIIRLHRMFLLSLALHAGPYNSVRATLDGWRATIRAEVAAEKMYPVNPAPYPQHGGRSLCSAQVHDNTNPPHYARIRAQQQQAEEAERGQHLQKQLSSAAAFLDTRAKGGMSTNADDVEYYLRRMATSAGGEGDDCHISIRILSKDEAMLTADEELVWARERFRADCAARAIRTYLEASVPAHDGPIPKVRNTPVGPAGPIPPLDTKLLVTSKVYYSPSLCLLPTLTQFC